MASYLRLRSSPFKVEPAPEQQHSYADAARAKTRVGTIVKKNRVRHIIKFLCAGILGGLGRVYIDQRSQSAAAKANLAASSNASSSEEDSDSSSDGHDVFSATRRADDSARVAPRETRRASERRVRASKDAVTEGVRGRKRAWRRGPASSSFEFAVVAGPARVARRRTWRSGDAEALSESRSSSASESIVGGTSWRRELRERERERDAVRCRAARRPRATHARASRSTRASSSAVSSSASSLGSTEWAHGGALGDDRVLSDPLEETCGTYWCGRGLLSEPRETCALLSELLEETWGTYCWRGLLCVLVLASTESWRRRGTSVSAVALPCGPFGMPVGVHMLGRAF